MTMTGRLGFRRELTLLFVALLCTACLPFPSTTADETVTTDYSNGFAFDQAHGITTQTSLLLTGDSQQPLRNTTWSLVNISTSTPITLLNGPYLTSVTPVGEDSFRWSLDINISGIDCTCFISLQTNWEGDSLFEPFLLVYLGDDHHRPVLLNEIGDDSTLETSEIRSIVSSNTIDLDFNLITPSGSHNDLQVEAEVCLAPYGVCLGESVSITPTYSSQGTTVTLSLNQSMLSLDDGIWFIDVSMSDALLRTSGKVRSSITFDSTAPTGVISGAERVAEGEEFQLYAELSDGYEGSKLTSIWSIHHDNGTVRAADASELLQSGTLLLNLTDSGNYFVELFVRDQAGYSVKIQHNFTVENIKPQVVLVADGLQLSGAQRVEVGPGSNWTLDGTFSVDNEAIDYLWVIDDSTSIRGQSQLTADDFDGKGEYGVELIVFDDDGATDSISFEIVISSYDEPLNQLVTPLQGFGLLMTLALVLFFVIRSNKKVDFDIPKWNATEGNLSSENHGSSHGRNATVEEDEARG